MGQAQTRRAIVTDSLSSAFWACPESGIRDQRRHEAGTNRFAGTVLVCSNGQCLPRFAHSDAFAIKINGVLIVAYSSLDGGPFPVSK
jgi:hypothetical protein